MDANALATRLNIFAATWLPRDRAVWREFARLVDDVRQVDKQDHADEPLIEWADETRRKR